MDGEAQGGMDVAVWNSNGTGGDLHGDKQNDIIKLIQENHVTVLLETRTNTLDSLMQHLPGITCFVFPVTFEGRGG
jgi:hypothetical protein